MHLSTSWRHHPAQLAPFWDILWWQPAFGTAKAAQNATADGRMTERDRQTEFLMRLMVLAESKTDRGLQARIEQAQHDENCIRFALTLVMFIGGFAVSGLGYCSVLHPEFFDSTAPTLVKLFCAVALGSLICTIVFLCCWWWYRKTSNRLYHECRQLVMDAIHERLRSCPKPQFVQTLDFSLPVPSAEQKRASAVR